MSPWRRRSLTIPPNSFEAWLQLATWEIWMGILVCLTLGLGISLIATAPTHIVSISDLSNCYGPPPVSLPCEQIIYRGGLLNAAFTSLIGVMFVGVGAWFLWELWSAVEPKPITDDFLRLLNDSFGRNWRNPLTWPWARVLWAYGFTMVGATLTVGVALLIWTLVAPPARAPTIKIDTSESFRTAQ